MSDLSQGVPDLDARLAEIDRRLWEIQAEVAPERIPRETRPPAAGPASAAEPTAESEPTAEAGQQPHGRTGPLAALLQRARERSLQPPPPPPPVAEPPPPAAPPEPPPPPPPDPAAQIQELATIHDRLLVSLRELLDVYERVLDQAPRRELIEPALPSEPSVPGPVPERADPGAASRQVTLSAGPFASIEALREFEQGLLAMAGVEEVHVRAYEGENRVILEVSLGRKTQTS